MPYFLRHYSPWVQKLIFYDGKSNDGTREIIGACGNAELRDWPGSDALDDVEFLAFANEQWKEARGQADWVIWVDADEFLYHPHILSVLERYLQEGVTVPQIEGYTMVSDRFPTTNGQIYDDIKTGFRDTFWDKQILFRENIYFNMGRHSLNLGAFNPRSSAYAEIKLLHYRCLGIDYLKNRHRRNFERIPEHCRSQSLGDNTYPNYVGHHSISWFEDVIKQTLPDVI